MYNYIYLGMLGQFSAVLELTVVITWDGSLKPLQTKSQKCFLAALWAHAGWYKVPAVYGLRVNRILINSCMMLLPDIILCISCQPCISIAVTRHSRITQ